ncbi:MAG: hypothetical protein AAF467_15880 [Actinomycetota bacterium]
MAIVVMVSPFTDPPNDQQVLQSQSAAVMAGADTQDTAALRLPVSSTDDAVGNVNLRAAPARPSLETALPQRSDGGAGVIRFVLFVEADQVYDPDTEALVATQAEAVQAYWYEQFGGTFLLPVGGVDVVFGDHPARWYDETPNDDDPRWNRLLNIRAEVIKKLDLDSEPEQRVITYPVARIDGRVGANSFDGAWMDGDDIGCVAGRVATVPYSTNYPADCLSTVVHELGHVYGLTHEGPDADCMQFGFYDYLLEERGQQHCIFSERNRQIVINEPRNGPWLAAEPGDRG